MNIDHFTIAAPMSLLDDVKAFYCQGLGLEDGPRPDFGIRGYWLYGDGKPIVHLLESDNHFRPERQQYFDHVAFAMQDLPGYTERLDQLGVEYSVNHIPDYNMSQVFCHDPCGNGVEANFVSDQAEAG